MKRLLLLLLFVAQVGFAQNTPNATPNPGNLTAAGSSCTSSNCVSMTLGPNAASASVTLNGTFTATIQFEESADGQTFIAASAAPHPSGALVSSATGTGTWVIPVAGMLVVRARVSSYTSGTVSASLYPSSAPFVVQQTGGTTTLGNVGLNAGTNAIGTVGVTGVPAPAQSASSSVQTPLTGSATGAASAANVTLAGTAAKTTYITGFQITGAGATAASVISVTITGTVTGTMNYNIAVPAGITTSITPLIVSFPIPVPASAVNTAIVVNVPSFGAGNTNSAVAAQGFQQ